MGHNYQKLKVWKAAVALAVDVYSATQHLPPEERYGFTSQTRRSATSVAANIAEGAGRGSDRDFRRHLRIARGSLYEFETLLEIAERTNLMASRSARSLGTRAVEIKKMLHALESRLQV